MTKYLMLIIDKCNEKKEHYIYDFETAVASANIKTFICPMLINVMNKKIIAKQYSTIVHATYSQQTDKR